MLQIRASDHVKIKSYFTFQCNGFDGDLWCAEKLTVLSMVQYRKIKVLIEIGEKNIETEEITSINKNQTKRKNK